MLIGSASKISTLSDSTPNGSSNKLHSQEHKQNIEKLIATLERYGASPISCEQKEILLSRNLANSGGVKPERFISPCFNRDMLLRSDYEFKDLKSGVGYKADAIKTELITNILNEKIGEKSISFDVPTVKFLDMEVVPLSSVEYKDGVPFLLSLETKHCDIVGGLGGNYPLAEYLSDDGVSCKVMRQGEYVGHFNVWKDSNGDFTIGTMAIKREEVRSEVLRHILDEFSVKLLMQNEGAKSILMGLGGQNLSIFHSAEFSESGVGYQALGRVRHADDIMSHAEDVKLVEDITGLSIFGGIDIKNQDNIGMAPDERPDMKNCLVFMNHGLIPAVAENGKSLHNKFNDSMLALRSKIDRAGTWEREKLQGEQRNKNFYEKFKADLEKDGVSGVRLERSQHQDIIVSADQPFHQSTEKNGRHVLKIRVTNDRSL